MNKTFLERKHETPDHDLTIEVSGVRLGTTSKIHWIVEVTDNLNENTTKTRALDVLEKVIEVLKDE